MGATIIGSVVAQLGIDTAAFDQGLKRSVGELGRIDVGKGLKAGVADLQASLGRAAGSLGALGSVLGGVGLGATAVAGSFALLAGKAREAAAFGDEIADSAAKIAISTDALQEYRYAVHALGGEYGDADTALASFSEHYGAALSKFSAKSVKPFQQLGLDPATLGSTDQALRTVIDAISKVGSTAEQAHIAEKLGITGLLPVARAGVGQLDDLAAAAHRLGFVMDADLVAKAGDANDKFEDLSHVIDVQFKSAFVEAAPAILTVTQGIADLVKGLRQVGDSQAFKHLADSAIAAIPGLQQVVVLAQAAGEARRVRDQIGGVKALLAGKPVDLSPLAPETPKGADRLNFGTTGSHKSGPTPEASAEAIAAANAELLRAKQDLTQNVLELARLRKEEVDAETEREVSRIGREAGKTIDRASAQIAQDTVRKAANLRKQAIDQDAERQLDGQRLAQADRINGYYDAIAQVNEQLAGTASERAALEAEILARAQESEVDHLKAEAADRGIDIAADLAALAKKQAAERLAQVEKSRVAIAEESARREQDALELKISLLQSAQDAAETEGERLVIGLRILQAEQALERERLKQVIATSHVTEEIEAAQGKLAGLDAIQANQIRAAVGGLLTNFDRTSGAVSDIGQAFKRHDWLRATEDLVNAIAFAQTALGTMGNSAAAFGSVAGLGSGVGSLIGGRTGRSVSGAFNILGAGASLGAGATLAGGELLATFGFGTGAAASIGVGLAGVLGTLGAVAPPLAAAAAVLYGVAKLFNIGAKPSNHGAGFDLRTGQLTGDKRTSETDQAAKAAGQAVQGFTDALKADGIKFTDSLDALVIGTRDQSYLYFQSGKTLRSAVGDSAAAVDAALHELLAGATYASDAQKTLVESLVAAGKGVDAIVTALGEFEKAQGVGADIAHLIQKFVDPEGSDIADLAKAQKARRDAVKAQAQYLSADTLAGDLAALDRLDALELGEVLKRYADQAKEAADTLVEAAASAAQAKDRDAEQATAAAQAALREALQRDVAAAQETAQKFAGLADQLDAVASELSRGAVSGLSPAAQAAADRANLQRLSGKAASGDADALAQLPDAIRAFVTSGTAQARTRAEADAIIAQGRAAAASGSAAARSQQSAAQQTVAALNAQLTATLGVDASVKSVAVLQGELNAAVAHQTQVMLQGLAGIAAAQVQAAGVIAAATRSNDNAPAATGAAAGPNLAALTASSATAAARALAATPAAQPTGAGALLAEQNAMLYAIAKATGITAEHLDDVINGPRTLNVVSA